MFHPYLALVDPYESVVEGVLQSFTTLFIDHILLGVQALDSSS